MSENQNQQKQYQQPATVKYYGFLLVSLLVNQYFVLFQKIKINKEESLLNTGQQSEYALIQEMIYRKEPFDKLWKTAVTFHSYHDKWMNGPLIEVNAEEVEEEVGMGEICVLVCFMLGALTHPYLITQL